MLILVTSYLVLVRVHLYFTQSEVPVACQVDTDVSAGQQSLANQRTRHLMREVHSSNTQRVGLIVVTVTFKLDGVFV